MSLLSRIFGRNEAPAETRAAGDRSWIALQHEAPATTAVNAKVAENLSTVLACVNAISTAIASLPAEIQRRTADGGWETDDAHPLARLITEGPNEHQSWPDFVEFLLASTLLNGNGLAEIERDGSGAARALRPIVWGAVGVQLLPSGRLAFDVSDTYTIPGVSGPPRRLLESEVLFLRDRTDDGLVGRSRLQRAAGVFGPAIDLQSFVGAMMQNGINPSGVLEHPGKLSEQAIENIRSYWQSRYSGPRNASRTLVLQEGMTWRPTSVSPEDAEVLASRRFTVEELARVYNVPPPVIGDLSHGTFTNSETMLRWFAMGTLTPWISKLENEFHRSVFGAASRRTHRLEIDLSGLLRGDPETRWASHKIAIETGALTVDEVRHVEGWAPRGEPAPAPAQEA